MKMYRVKKQIKAKRITPLTREDITEVVEAVMKKNFEQYVAELMVQLKEEMCNANAELPHENDILCEDNNSEKSCNTRKNKNNNLAAGTKKEIRPETDIESVFYAVDYWVRLANLFPNRSFFARRNQALRLIYDEMRNDYGFVKEQTLKEYLYAKGLHKETKVSYLTALLFDETWRKIFTGNLSSKINNAFENAGLAGDSLLYWADKKGSDFVDEMISKLYTERGWKKIIQNENKSKQEIIRTNPAVRLKFCHLCMSQN